MSQSEYRYLTSELLKSFFKKSLQVWHEDVFICYASMQAITKPLSKASESEISHYSKEARVSYS